MKEKSDHAALCIICLKSRSYKTDPEKEDVRRRDGTNVYTIACSFAVNTWCRVTGFFFADSRGKT